MRVKQKPRKFPTVTISFDSQDEVDSFCCMLESSLDAMNNSPSQEDMDMAIENAVRILDDLKQYSSDPKL